MKKIYALLIATFLLVSAGNSYSANVDVYNNAALTGGYASLDLALAQVGVAPNTGTVEVKINTSHTSGSGTINNSNYTTCKIFPTANGITVTYTLTATCILLSGADNVTIDGSLNGTGTSRQLTIDCITNAAGLRGIQTQNGSQNVIIRYVNVNVPVMTAAVTGGRCVNIAQSTALAQGGQDNNTVEYCNLSGGDRTLQTFGSDNIVFNTNTIIRNNIVRNAASLHIFLGSFAKDIICENNEIYDDVPVYKAGTVTTNASNRAIGMQGCGNSIVRNNIIHDLNDIGLRATSLSIQGMICIPVRSTLGMIMPATNSVTIYNNMIRLAQNNVKATTLYGLFVSATADPNAQNYSANVYNNTALLGGTGALQEFTYALIFDVPNSPSSSGTSSATYYNNVGLNVRAALSTSQHVGMDFEVEPGVPTVSDYNTAYADDPTASLVGGTYFNTVDATFGYVSIWNWKEANCGLGCEQFSAFHPVNYDINYAITNQNYGDLNAKPLALVTTDLFGVTRATTYPYRGAVEGPALKVLTVTAGLEARTGPDPSNILVVLYDGCTFVDYAMAYVTDASNTPKYLFSTAVANGTAYTLQCLTATHLEAWSSGTSTFTAGNASYLFNSSSSIYGGVGTPSGEFIAGDINQDGAVDAFDVSAVENAQGLEGCRVSEDVSYDEIVDAFDLSTLDNNAGTGWYSAPVCVLASMSTDKRLESTKKSDKVKLTTDRKSSINQTGF